MQRNDNLCLKFGCDDEAVKAGLCKVLFLVLNSRDFLPQMTKLINTLGDYRLNFFRFGKHLF